MFAGVGSPITQTFGLGIHEPLVDKDLDAIERFFQAFMGPELGGQPRLVRAPGHIFTDHATPYLSLINLASVQELERALGRPVDPLRFRANLYVLGLPAWAELDWPGCTLGAGAVRCRVAERIERCAATNVDPVSAERDLNIPLALRRHWGHIDCGVLLGVVRGGRLETGQAIGPGAMPFTRTSGPSSRASARVRPASPVLATL